MGSLTPLIGLKILLLSLSKKKMSVWGGRMWIRLCRLMLLELFNSFYDILCLYIFSPKSFFLSFDDANVSKIDKDILFM